MKNQVIVFENRYQVGDIVLGQGSFGKVVKGFDIIDNKYVAVKIVSIKQLQQNKKLGELFVQEFNIQQSLDSTFVVKLYNVYKANENFYLILEYCQDGDLEKYVKNNQPLSEKQVIGFSLQILAGLRELHSKSVVHRDLKPANIVLHKKKLKIADFGASRVIENGMDGKTIIGTPLFLAPEIQEEKQYGFEVDIFSFGVLLYFMLYKDYPFTGEKDELQENKKSQNINFKKGGLTISKQMQDLIERLLKFNRDDRISWKQIYEHPIFKNYMKNDNISAEIILAPSIDDISMYDGHKFLNKKGEMNGNKIGQFQIIENKSTIILANKEEEEEIAKLAMLIEEQDNDFYEGIRKYVYKKNIYGILMNLVKSFKLFSNSGINDYIPAFLVSKKLKSLNNELYNAINFEKNIFKMKFFDIFLKSEQYKRIKLAVKIDQCEIDKYFYTAQKEADDSIINLGINDKKLKDEINNMNQTDAFQEYFKSALINCGYSYQGKLKQTNKKEDKANLFLHIMLIYQAVSIDKQFKDNSNLDFDFEKYKNQLLEVEPKDYQTRMDEACAIAFE